MQRASAPKRTLSDAKKDLDQNIDAAILAMSEAGMSDEAIVATVDAFSRNVGDLLQRAERLRSLLHRARRGDRPSLRDAFGFGPNP